MSRRARHALLVLASLASAGTIWGACSSTSSTPSPPEAGGDASLPADGSIGAFDGNLIVVTDAAAGGACEASSDCPSGLSCLYPLAEACSATGVCAILQASQCAGPYCTCRGDTTAACGAYGNLPMEMPLHGPPCTAAGDGGADAGHD